MTPTEYADRLHKKEPIWVYFCQATRQFHPCKIQPDHLHEEEPPRLFFCQEDEDSELIGH